MSQPPPSPRPPDWRRPRGVAPGTWDYVNERSIADHYDQFVADTPLCDFDHAVLAEYFPPVDPAAGTVVADLGCGTGRSAVPLAQRGYRVLGIDLSLPMLRQLAEKATDAELAIDPIHANLVELNGIADNSVDHAICMFSTLGMIQNTCNRRDMLLHASRIVRPGGNVVAHVHNRWAALREPRGIRNLVKSWWAAIGRGEHEFGDTTYSYRGLDKMFMHRFSVHELQNALNATGWQVQRLLRISVDGAGLAKRASIAGGFIVVAKNR